MEEVFISIMERINAEMPELSLIDEDYGQLEMGIDEDHYPVTFPCVLISDVNTDWDDIGMGAQNGMSSVTVRLAVDCYDDTSLQSGTYTKSRERLLFANRLYKALQCFVPADNCSELVRVKERSYSLPHYIKVYEKIFSFSIHDESACEND